jgi:hypothetical protein
MKKLFTLISFLFISSLSIGQISSDTTKKQLPIMLNRSNELKQISMNLGRGTDSYKTSDIMFLTSIGVGILATVANANGLFPDVGMGIYVLPILINGCGWIIRFEGHSEMKNASKNLENYSNTLR